MTDKREERKALYPNDYRRRFYDFVRPSADALAERNARAHEGRSLTARLMGDPMPGFSALDKRAE